MRLNEASPALLAVLESAARLQELVPDAVLVGRSMAALYAAHRDSFDHDHVVADLRDRFEVVLDALESEGEWVTNRVQPGKLILGRLGSRLLRKLCVSRDSSLCGGIRPATTLMWRRLPTAMG